MIAHVVLFWGPYVRDCFKLAHNKEQPDPHYQVSMAPLREGPNSPTLYRRCKSTKKIPGGGILSCFFWHSSPVNHLSSSFQKFAESFFRIGCCLQRTDHPSLVVIHRCSALWRIYHRKLYSIKQKETVYIYAICAAFLNRPLCTHGQWSCNDPIDEDGSRCC